MTNYPDFVLLGQDVNGQPAKLETYRLAANEEFWQKAQNPRAFAQEHEEQITEYLKRVMLQQATIASPQDLAWFLASYAKDARARIEKSDLPALETIRTALEEALGISFKEEQGDRFFKSTLIQTLFYLSDYLDDSMTNAQVAAIAPRFMKSSGEFDAEKTRSKLKGNIQYDSSKILRYPITDPDEDTEIAVLIWMHTLAIGYSPAYLEENADGIRENFPPIPLPNNRDLLIAWGLKLQYFWSLKPKSKM